MTKRDWYCEDVLSGKLDVQRVYEDDHVLAFHHPRPAAEIHVVVVPKSHVPSLLDEAALDGDLLSSMVRAIQATVTPHMHWHVLGPGAGADWPRL